MTTPLLIRYNAAAALASTMDLSRHAELAHRRLADWTWVNQRPPTANDRLLCAIARCTPAQWKTVAPALNQYGWRPVRGRFTHRAIMRALREAQQARRAASDLSAAGNRARWGSARTPAGTPARIPPGLPPGSLLNNSKIQSTKGSLHSSKCTEHLMRGASLPKKQLDQEKSFLEQLRQLCEHHRQGSGQTELDDWGGWFRLRFREQPRKAARILAEVAGMLRERKLLKSPGAAFYDLWQRLPDDPTPKG